MYRAGRAEASGLASLGGLGFWSFVAITRLVAKLQKASLGRLPARILHNYAMMVLTFCEIVVYYTREGGWRADN